MRDGFGHAEWICHSKNNSGSFDDICDDIGFSKDFRECKVNTIRRSEKLSNAATLSRLEDEITR